MQEILVELLQNLREAHTIEDVNIAAGIAEQRIHFEIVEVDALTASLI